MSVFMCMSMQKAALKYLSEYLNRYLAFVRQVIIYLAINLVAPAPSFRHCVEIEKGVV